MRKRIWATLILVAIAGGFSAAGGQEENRRIQSLDHSYVIHNKWYGFVTDTVTLRSIGTGSNSNRGDRFDLDGR